MRTTRDPSVAAVEPSPSAGRAARVARAPVVLLLAAALVLPVSGVMALDAPVSLPSEPSLAAQPATANERAPPTTPAPQDPVPATSPFTTGQQLDADERAAFLAWVAAQQANGQHRGVAIYSSW